MHTPVSVVLPAWNAASTIAAALRSVKRQTYAHWECCVVDDGSTDDTAAVVSTLAADDPRIRVIRTDHRGLVSALNEGLHSARGTFIARMDADDLMHRERLAVQVARLQDDASLGAVGCHVRVFPRSGMSPRLREYEFWLNSLRSADEVARDSYVECPVAHPTLMMRREMAALGYADRAWPEDYDLVLRALAAGLRIGVVTRRLLAWRDRPHRLSRTDPAYDIDRFTACKAHFLARGYLARHDRYVLWGFGDTGRRLRRALEVHNKTPSHIVEVKAARIGQQIHGARVIPIDAVPGVRGTPIVVSVARAGPRSEIRDALRRMGFCERRDFVCTA
jgi:glycosyltransferase involved in cell wall biosynthesis